jgi:hypothetical protein
MSFGIFVEMAHPTASMKVFDGLGSSIGHRFTKRFGCVNF